MDISKILAICCFILGIPQGFSSILQLIDRFNRKHTVNIDSTRPHHTFTAFLLLASTFITIFLGFWVWFHPLKSTVIEKTITVEKALPCPAIKTGSATAHSGSGSTSIAHSGNGDDYNIQPSAKPPK